MNQMDEWVSAEFGGPAMGALPAFKGDKLRPHKSGGGGGGSTTTQSIPTELKPLASAYADKAMDLSDDAYNPYKQQRFAELNGTQSLGLSSMINRAKYGDKTIDAGSNFIQGQLKAGDQSATKNQYMGRNPYLDRMVGKALDSIRSQFNTGAVSSGSFGNSGLQEQFQRGLSDTAAQMYGADYANTQQLGESYAARNDQVRQNQDANQLQSAQLGLQYGNQKYADADQMLKAGQIQQDQKQQGLDFNYQQFQEKENLPYKQLAAMSGVFSSGLGSQTTSKTSGGGK
jgi:hypothetical protein